MGSRDFFHHITERLKRHGAAGEVNVGKAEADNPLSPYGSAEEILVANTVYNLQQSGKNPRVESLVFAVPGNLKRDDIIRSLFLLEGKGLLTLSADETGEKRYSISENDGIILGRIIEENRAEIQECLNRHQSREPS